MLLALRSLLEVAGPSLRDANQAAGKSVTISVVAGDAIWIGFVVAGAVDLSTSCADTAGGGTNAYTVDAALDGNSGWSMYSFHAVAKATETITVTITNPYTASARTFYHVEAGCASVGLVDGAAVTNLDGAAVTTHPSANLTTTNPNDVIISFWIQADVGTTIGENGTGFTRRITQGGMGTFDRVVTTYGTYNESVISTVATVYGSILVAFKAAPTSISGSGGTVQAVQTLAGTGTCAAPLSGSGGTTQAIQTLAGTGNCTAVTGSGGTIQAIQTISGTGTCAAAAPLTGSGGTIQSVQSVSGSGYCQPASALNGPPVADIQTLTPGAEFVGYVLDATALGGALYRFHAGTNPLGNSVVWQGQTYLKYPIQAGGFEMTSKGVMPRPTLSVANIDGTIAAAIRAYGDLVGATLTRKRTLAKFLDAANFAGGNPSADPTAQFADDVFYIERKSDENQLSITFELSAACDLQGLLLPRRIVQASCCMWNDAAVCPYSVGGACTKTLAACKSHWGATADLPFGGFPGSGLVNR